MHSNFHLFQLGILTNYIKLVVQTDWIKHVQIGQTKYQLHPFLLYQNKD